MLSVSSKITREINNMPEDMVFGYDQLPIEREEFWSAAKTLERLQKKGLVKKLSKGRFYKPKMTVFGEKLLGEQEMLKPYLYKKGRRTAYITGTSLYNQLGLTTQIPSVIQIASWSRGTLVDMGAIRVSPVRSYADVSEQNYQMLGFLDAMKDLKQIPDLDISAALTIFRTRIKALDKDQEKKLIQYALLYPPRARALLGALLEDIGDVSELAELRESLNPLTKFELGITEKELKTAPKWSIQ